MDIPTSKAAAYASLADQARAETIIARDQTLKHGNAVAAIRDAVDRAFAQVQTWIGQVFVDHRWLGTTLEIRGPDGEYAAGVDLKGDDGWAPLLAIVNDGARRVLKITDWTSGSGSKPASDRYLGPTGLVDDVEDAVDIRGAAYRSVTGGATVTMLSTDEAVGINKTVGSATAVTLPPSPYAGQPASVFDAKGDAATNPITISPAAGTINGGTSVVIDTNFGWVHFRHSGTEWNIVG